VARNPRRAQIERLSASVDGPIVGLRADVLIVDPYDAASGPAHLMSAIEFDEEAESREITSRELDRERDDVLDTSHVADQVR